MGTLALSTFVDTGFGLVTYAFALTGGFFLARAAPGARARARTACIAAKMGAGAPC
eukprot:COSAG02_NODE_33724_length_495_cov_1.613636_1_plen_56_part_00